MSLTLNFSDERPNINPHHRQAIDGLRAIAVIPVILFHMDVLGFGGGFIGVDVFFVISGFLITGILLKSKNEPVWPTIRKFYTRRARRILPALLMVLLASTLMALVVLDLAQQNSFFDSLVASLFMVSNFYFEETTGYFSDDSALSPLLHTWSLAVEEQFYLAFPFVLLLAMKRKSSFAPLVIAGLAIASLAYAQLVAGLDGSPGYFSTFSRAWELLLGSLAALFVARKNNWLTKTKFGNLASGIGLALVLGSMVGLDQTFPYPSAFTLLPVVGTALILVFTTDSNVVGQLLSNKLLVFIGLISYSAYLWHQPVLVFVNHFFGHANVAAAGVLVMMLILGLAYLSWKFVETPFRSNGPKQIQRVGLTLSSGFAAVAVIALIGGMSINAMPPSKAADEQNSALTHEQIVQVMEASFGRNECFIDFDQDVDTLISHHCLQPSTDTKDVILFGDSFAAHHYFGFKSQSETLGASVMQWTAASCRPVVLDEASQRCLGFLEGFFDKTENQFNENDFILISARWSSMLQELSRSQFETKLTDTIFRLKRSGARVFLLGPTPEWEQSTRTLITSNGSNVQLAGAFTDRATFSLKKIAELTDITLIEPMKALCASRNICLVKKDGKHLFLDQGHLSPAGSALVANYVTEEINK